MLRGERVTEVPPLYIAAKFWRFIKFLFCLFDFFFLTIYLYLFTYFPFTLSINNFQKNLI
jgi:hypothetical protein